MIVSTVAIGCFSILFSMGVLFNNKYVSMEDALTTKQVYIDFDKDVLWEDNYDAFYDMCKVFESSMHQVSILNLGELDIAYSSMADMEDGSFVLGPDFDRFVIDQISSGRNLMQEDFTEGKKVALVTPDLVADSITYGGEEYEVVGIRSMDYFNSIIMLPITAWGNNPVSVMTIELEKLPTYAQYKKIKKLLDENFAGKYHIGDYYDKDVDLKALYRTISLVAVGIIAAVLITIFFLMGYIYDNRRYQTVVFRLMGCKRRRAVGYFVWEALFLVLPSEILGTALFVLARRLVFDKYYLYMDGLFNFKIYMLVAVVLTAAVLLEIFVMSEAIMHRQIKAEITEVER